MELIEYKPFSGIQGAFNEFVFDSNMDIRGYALESLGNDPQGLAGEISVTVEAVGANLITSTSKTLKLYTELLLALSGTCEENLPQCGWWDNEDQHEIKGTD